MAKEKKRRRLFCEYGPVCYWLALRRTILARRLRDRLSGERLAVLRKPEAPLPEIVKAHRSLLLRPLEGVDMALQRNKAVNLRLAAGRMDGVLVRPGEIFSFWRLVGNPTARKGFLAGLVLESGKPARGIGGGLCQLANLVHWLVMHSGLTVTELHHHTDAIFPDAGRRVPFGTGTSVFYNAVDYRFCNNTRDTYQVRVWLDETDLCGELRCSALPPRRYRIEERDHHFRREGEDWFRNSEIWRKTIDRETGRVLDEELLFRNHSRVLYDAGLIPKEEVRL